MYDVFFLTAVSLFYASSIRRKEEHEKKENE